MEVILKEDMASLGKAGEVVKVKNGFARNFLFPQGKALPADKGNLKLLEQQKKKIAAERAKAKETAEKIADQLSSCSVQIAKEAGEDKLFGSVTSLDIATALRNQGIIVDKRSIEMEDPIKQLGDFSVSIRLHPEVRGTVKISVVRK